MPPDSKSPDSGLSVDDLNERMSAARVRCITANHFLRQVSAEAHSCRNARDVPDSIGRFQTLLRLCADSREKQSLPAYEVAAEYAAIDRRETVSSIKRLAERFVSRNDLDPPMSEDPKLLRALAYTERRTLEWQLHGKRNVTFDPMYRDGGRLQFEGARVDDIEKQRLASQIDLLRTIFHVQCNMLMWVREDTLEEPLTQERFLAVLKNIRNRLGHIGYVNGDRREHVLSMPLIMGALYNQICLDHRSASTDPPTIEEVLEERNPDLPDRMLQERDEDLKSACEAAKIVQNAVRDYSPVSRQEDPPIYDPAEHRGSH